MKCVFTFLCVYLGFPSCLQVYQMDTGHYLCRNKYYGRGLSIEGFRHALYQFMHNGTQLRRDLFEPILSKLRSLKAVLERQASYRFYSSSLLIIYEGKEPEAEVWTKTEALASNKETSQGLSLSHNNPQGPPPLTGAAPGAQPPVDLLPPSQEGPVLHPHPHLDSQAHLLSPSVDVRMIDFAHSTFKGFRDDQTVHDGPDRGYVFGLESLIKILEAIREENK